MQNLRAADPLTLTERAELEARYDGPITQSAVDHVISQRGVPEYVPTVEDMQKTLAFVRNELSRERAKRHDLQMALVNAVADWDVAPLHDKDRTHRIAYSVRQQLKRQTERVDALIDSEIDLEDAIRERARALLQAAE